MQVLWFDYVHWGYRIGKRWSFSDAVPRQAPTLLPLHPMLSISRNSSLHDSFDPGSYRFSQLAPAKQEKGKFYHESRARRRRVNAFVLVPIVCAVGLVVKVPCQCDVLHLGAAQYRRVVQLFDDEIPRPACTPPVHEPGRINARQLRADRSLQKLHGGRGYFPINRRVDCWVVRAYLWYCARSSAPYKVHGQLVH